MDNLHFANYFLKLDGSYWEDLNEATHFKRKIIVPSGVDEVFNILLNSEELLELKDLFRGVDRPKERPVKAEVAFFCKN
ncbi:MAG: DUF6686 family protein [Bacteroidota bacterium]